MTELSRRDLFKGLAAALVVAQMPLPVEALIEIPEPQAITYLKRVRKELLEKITYPPCIMHEDGRVEQLSIEPWFDALKYVNRLIAELES